MLCEVVEFQSQTEAYIALENCVFPLARISFPPFTSQKKAHIMVRKDVHRNERQLVGDNHHISNHQEKPIKEKSTRNSQNLRRSPSLLFNHCSKRRLRLSYLFEKDSILFHHCKVSLCLLLSSLLFFIASLFQRNAILTRSNSLQSVPSVTDPTIGDYSKRLEGLSIEIFSAPKPFVDEDAINNKRAIRSWLRLSPRPRVTLLGYEEGYEEAAEEFGLNIERRVDKSFLGVPLFNSMFERANTSSATVTVIINGDILLFDDFMTTIRRIVSTFEDFLIISARYDIDRLPDDIQEDHPDYLSEVRRHVWATGTLHTYGGMDVWAWNTNGPPLFDPVMPHFVFGRGKYDNWLTHETIAAGRRQVVDVSETCLTVHVKHDYHFVDGGLNSSKEAVAAFWSKGKNSKFELFINIYLSLHSGTYSNQKGNVMFAPWKLAKCVQGDGMCLLKRLRPGICNCEFSSFMQATQTDPVVSPGTRLIRCGMLSQETRDSFVIPVRPPKQQVSLKYEYDENDNLVKQPTHIEPPPFGLPLTLTSLLEKVVLNNTVILTALNFGYRNIMMNWVCNMRQLAITNFVIAAFDEQLYKWAFTRSLPIYFETTIFEGMNKSSLAHAAYGSDDFKALTKMKSRVVLRLLKKGVNVIWTDCDIVYFRNPLQDLWSYGVDIAIQSNAPDDEPLNGRRRINSGFYLVKSNQGTIKTFREIIEFATKSKMSEQPCFYDVMCGKSGETTVGDDMCKYNNVTVKLLDRSRYPNGITAGIWNTADGRIPHRWPHLYVLHNNWIVGSGKEPRFERHGFIFFDKRSEICTYSLHVHSPTTPTSSDWRDRFTRISKQIF